MPNKHNDKYHHKFKKAVYKVKNWPKYNDALRKRGDITVWFTEEAIQAWIPKCTGMKGRPQKYSNLAIETCLFLRMVSMHGGLGVSFILSLTKSIKSSPMTSLTIQKAIQPPPWIFWIK